MMAVHEIYKFMQSNYQTVELKYMKEGRWKFGRAFQTYILMGTSAVFPESLGGFNKIVVKKLNKQMGRPDKQPEEFIQDVCDLADEMNVREAFAREIVKEEAGRIIYGRIPGAMWKKQVEMLKMSETIEKFRRGVPTNLIDECKKLSACW